MHKHHLAGTKTMSAADPLLLKLHQALAQHASGSEDKVA
jgi:hypothetical protein